MKRKWSKPDLISLELKFTQSGPNINVIMVTAGPPMIYEWHCSCCGYSTGGYKDEMQFEQDVNHHIQNCPKWDYTNDICLVS